MKQANHSDSTDIRIRVGLRIKELRASTELSQEALAYKIGMARSYLAEVETGKRNVSIDNIERIASGLDSSVALFFNSPLFEGKKTPLD